DLEWINPSLRLGKMLDLSSTYDDATIASERFARFASDWPGPRFLPLPGVAGFYLMVVDPLVRVDQTKIRVMKDPCAACGRFSTIAGSVRRPLAGERVPSGFSRTDTDWSS